MIIISNHALDIPGAEDIDPTVRVNLAWISDELTAGALLARLTAEDYEIYLDYPQGRTKPPRPTITLEQAIELANTYSGVKYFAVSNVEDPEAINDIRQKIDAKIEIVPKIETKKGIENMELIESRIKCKYMMLDKEDLWTDIGRDMDTFDGLIQQARDTSKRLSFTLLELQGVVFA